MKYAIRMSFPIPSYNQHLPVVSPAAGDKTAYTDPNTPEAIIKQVAEVRAQAAVDTIYDVPTADYHDPEPISNAVKKEAFCDYNRTSTMQILMVITTLLFIVLVSHKHLRYSAKMFLLTAAVLCITLVISVYSRDE
jgi:hypothetical protein